jgi:hypothetical protein
MRRCVHVLVCLVAVGVASCKKKSAEPKERTTAAPDAGLAAQVPKVDAAEALAPASVALPVTIAYVAADGTVTGLPPPRPPAPPAMDAGAEQPDDGEGESGGTGSLVNLDEAQLAREKAIEMARHPHDPGNAELLRKAFEETPKGERYLGVSHPARPARGVPPEVPQRQGKAIGETLDEPLPEAMPQLLIAAHPAAKARALVDLLAVHPALLAVEHEGATRALRVGFVDRHDLRWSTSWSRWLEVRVTGDQILVEGVPGMAKFQNGAVDAAALAEAWRSQRELEGLSDRVDVDVLVDAAVDVQRLVDVLAALDHAGARVFALGHLPAAESDELKKRGRGPIRFVQLGPLQAVGGVDKKVIEAALMAEHPAFLKCWDQALARNPKARGTVTAQFFIAPTGAVTDSRASGIDADTSECMAKVIRGLELPRPSGGAGAQVNAPFRMRT